MPNAITGLHHVTAMCGDAQTNVGFYTETLGLRMVKVTVNFDDPGTYHFYYGTEFGAPGSLLTFFPWADAPSGKAGTGAANVVSLSIPPDSLEYWQARLDLAGTASTVSENRSSERTLTFADPDGMLLKLVETDDPREPWTGSDVPTGAAIRGLRGVELWIDGYQASADLLTGPMGAVAEAELNDRFRFWLGEEATRAFVDLRCLPGLRPARLGPGSVHHVAFRVADLATEQAVALTLTEAGMNTTPPRERVYFQSVYFREPGHVLYELATDGPGFALDEPAESLGTRLCLPEWLEGHRMLIRQALPPIRLPSGQSLP